MATERGVALTRGPVGAVHRGAPRAEPQAGPLGRARALASGPRWPHVCSPPDLETASSGRSLVRGAARTPGVPP